MKKTDMGQTAIKKAPMHKVPTEERPHLEVKSKARQSFVAPESKGEAEVKSSPKEKRKAEKSSTKDVKKKQMQKA